MPAQSKPLDPHVYRSRPFFKFPNFHPSFSDCTRLIARAIAGYPVCIENQVWGKTPGKLLSNHPSTRVPCPCFENGKGKERLRGMSQEHLKVRRLSHLHVSFVGPCSNWLSSLLLCL